LTTTISALIKTVLLVGRARFPLNYIFPKIASKLKTKMQP